MSAPIASCKAVLTRNTRQLTRYSVASTRKRTRNLPTLILKTLWTLFEKSKGHQRNRRKERKLGSDVRLQRRTSPKDEAGRIRLTHHP